MPRYFIGSLDVASKQAIISGSDALHIKKVMRLGPGDIIQVSDGRGEIWIACIVSVHGNDIIARLDVKSDSVVEPKIRITLYQGMPKADKMDFIIQKCVELGIDRIVPVLTERTIVKFEDASREKRKIERWNKIAQEASKQCYRLMIPPVELPISFDEAVARARECCLAIIPYERESSRRLKPLLEENSHARNIGIFIGPEGGFSESEVQMAVQNGIQPVTLGPRILRTETAGMAAVTILMYQLGDMG